MINITEIMDMLDWNMPYEIQYKGRNLAKELEVIKPFIQPLTPKHNKNVWENCAFIVADKSDEQLLPYLTDLLEWLQDMNWPGAFCIYNRLNKLNSTHFDVILNNTIEKSRLLKDDMWTETLCKLKSDRNSGTYSSLL